MRPAEPETARFLNVPLEGDLRLEPVVVGISVCNRNSDARYTSEAPFGVDAPHLRNRH